MILEYISIFNFIKELKKNYPSLTKEDMRLKLRDMISKGALYRGKHLKIVYQEVYNGLMGSHSDWYYFVCPLCSKRSRKIYYLDNKIGCRKCLKIKNMRNVNTSSDRIMRMQENLSAIFSGKMSSAKKRKLLNDTINHYAKLDEGYKLAYNTFVFRALQDWCLEKLREKDNSSDYRKAVKDVLGILQDSRKIIIKSGLGIPRNKKIGI